MNNIYNIDDIVIYINTYICEIIDIEEVLNIDTREISNTQYVLKDLKTKRTLFARKDELDKSEWLGVLYGKNNKVSK